MPLINKPDGLNKIWSSTGAAIAPDDTKIAEGWVVEAPPHQTENWINKKHDTALASLNQLGFFIWDAVTEYQGGKSWTLGSNGAIYFCKVTNTNNNPVTDTPETYWRKVMDGNAVITFPLVSTYVKNTFFPSANASAARTNLGISTVGSNVATAASQSAARTAIGSGVVGDVVFTATSQINARTAIGVVDADDVTKGLVQRATDPETIAGVEDTKFLTPKKLKLGFSQSATANGFLRLPSWLGGLEFRWGSTLIPSNSSIGVASFPNTCLVAVASLGMNTTNDFQPTKAYISGTGVILYNSDSNTVTSRWIAIGN